MAVQGGLGTTTCVHEARGPGGTGAGCGGVRRARGAADGGRSAGRWATRSGTVRSVLSVLAQDPTGLSSPVGRLVVLAGLLAALVLLLRWWWQGRGR